MDNEQATSVQQWEYWSGILWAHNTRKPKPGMEPMPKYSPMAMIPDLNAMGEEGWELVHMQPVVAGENQDVLMLDTMRTWTNAYLCVFKKPKRS